MSHEHETSRRPSATRTHRWTRTLAQTIASLGVPPNAISMAGVVFALLGAASVLGSRHAEIEPRVALLVSAAFCVPLRLLANLLDGLVAIEGGRATSSGPLFNEVPDRVADVVLLVAAGFVPGAVPGTALLGFVASHVAVFTAYVRALGVSVGARADFSGPMAKPQRMACLTLGCLASAMEAALGLPLRAMALTLLIVTLGGVVTAARRLRTIARELENA